MIAAVHLYRRRDGNTFIEAHVSALDRSGDAPAASLNPDPQLGAIGSQAGQPRLYFVGWLRVFLISLVVAHHAGQPYGPTGGSWPVEDPVNAEWLGPFFGVNAAFFMGFFFLIAGYFTGPSYDRKGGAAFVRDRLIRLGIPLVFFTFFVFGPLVCILSNPPEGFLACYFGTYIGRWQIEMGPLWFIAQLLVYDLIYALWRATLGRGSPTRAYRPPGDREILLYTLALAIIDVLVRTVFPQDAWIRILGLVPAEPAHMPQYVSLFVIGIVAGRGQWFTRLPSAVGVRWFVIGVVAFLIAGFADFIPVDFWLVWGFLEAFVCVGLILGLTVLFRRYGDRPGRWLDRLDGSVYGVYLVHFFVVWALQAAILNAPLSATAKFAIVTAAALVISFSLVAALRQVPVIRRII